MIYEDIDFYKGLAVYILPDDVTSYFDLVNFSEESARESDQLYKTKLHLYLDELDADHQGHGGYDGKGATVGVSIASLAPSYPMAL